MNLAELARNGRKNYTALSEYELWEPSKRVELLNEAIHEIASELIEGVELMQSDLYPGFQVRALRQYPFSERIAYRTRPGWQAGRNSEVKACAKRLEARNNRESFSDGPSMYHIEGIMHMSVQGFLKF